MKGISTILTMVLIVVITVAIIGLIYGWATGLFGTVAEASDNLIESQTNYLSASMRVSAATPTVIYIRNTGQSKLSEFIIFKNDKTISSNKYNVIPSILPAGDTVKIELVGTLLAYEGEKNIIKIITREGAEAYITVSNISNAFDYKVGIWDESVTTSYCDDGTCNGAESCSSCPVDCGTCIYGCTDPTATNYNPNATVDDGLCEYPLECNYSDAINYVNYEFWGMQWVVMYYDQIFNSLRTVSSLPPLSFWNGYLAAGNINMCQYDKIILRHWYI